MRAKKPIDFAPLEDDEISLDTSEELPRFVELTNTTQEVANQLKHNQSFFVIEPNEDEYRSVDGEGACTTNTLFQHPSIIRVFHLLETL